MLEAAWLESMGEWDRHAEAIHQHLSDWQPVELVDFVIIQNRRRLSTFTPLMFNAAFMVWDGALGNDGFLDFTDALSVIPNYIFESILSDPDNLIEVPALWTPCEEYYWHMPFKVFDEQRKVKQGTDLLNDYLPPDEPPEDLWTRLKGHPNRQISQSMLPRLYARFGKSAFA